MEHCYIVKRNEVVCEVLHQKTSETLRKGFHNEVKLREWNGGK